MLPSAFPLPFQKAALQFARMPSASSSEAIQMSFFPVKKLINISSVQLLSVPPYLGWGRRGWFQRQRLGPEVGSGTTMDGTSDLSPQY